MILRDFRIIRNDLSVLDSCLQDDLMKSTLVGNVRSGS